MKAAGVLSTCIFMFVYQFSTHHFSANCILRSELPLLPGPAVGESRWGFLYIDVHFPSFQVISQLQSGGILSIFLHSLG